jgi:hypothetical protein
MQVYTRLCRSNISQSSLRAWFKISQNLIFLILSCWFLVNQKNWFPDFHKNRSTSFWPFFLIHAQDRQIEKDWGRHQHGLREVKDHMNGDDWIGGRLERKGKTVLFVGSMVIWLFPCLSNIVEWREYLIEAEKDRKIHFTKNKGNKSLSISNMNMSFEIIARSWNPKCPKC